MNANWRVYQQPSPSIPPDLPHLPSLLPPMLQNSLKHPHRPRPIRPHMRRRILLPHHLPLPPGLPLHNKPLHPHPPPPPHRIRRHIPPSQHTSIHIQRRAPRNQLSHQRHHALPIPGPHLHPVAISRPLSERVHRRPLLVRDGVGAGSIPQEEELSDFDGGGDVFPVRWHQGAEERRPAVGVGRVDV